MNFLDEKIELVVSESQLLINNIRQQRDWKEEFESTFENKLKAVEQLLKEKPGSQDLLEIQMDLTNELEQLRLEAGPAKAPPQVGERSKDPQIQHNSVKVATLDVQSDLQLESKLIDEINKPTGQPSSNLSNLTASLTIIQQNTLRIIRSDITALQKNLDSRRAEVEKSLEKLSLSINAVSKENAALKSRLDALEKNLA